MCQLGPPSRCDDNSQAYCVEAIVSESFEFQVQYEYSYLFVFWVVQKRSLTEFL